MPPAIERNDGDGTSITADREMRTVTPESSTALPAVSMVSAIASRASHVEAGFDALAPEFVLDWRLYPTAVRPRVLILVSKEGHCLNDLLYRQRSLVAGSG